MTANSSAPDVTIVGGGVAGLSAGIFTARAGLGTLVATHGHPILRRNAHLENVPGFPAGVNSRLFLDMLEAQAERAGCTVREGEVVDVEADGEGEGFEVRTADDGHRVASVIAASWPDADYLEGTGVEFDDRGAKRYVEVDPDGRTAVAGLYAAGRLAGQYHQTAVNAGHGARVAITLLHDSDVPFYHDWVAPEGYFTDRGIDVPPGCEEIDDEERRRRERESMRVMRAHFADPHPEEPVQHPALREADGDGADDDG
ncbi:NAD(P)/FAD-dependent oxidoreductase [Salinilacihabitans rarus]|uniref:NAD(P)/FAD-dependent oxidoreductase n=1 Tax=Salinilacihabitans rarus TaxID=2961596 RepID=UPI0020C8A8FC|nr:FAD-binding protein [Salinilacihabitans rarus]